MLGFDFVLLDDGVRLHRKLLYSIAWSIMAVENVGSAAGAVMEKSAKSSNCFAMRTWFHARIPLLQCAWGFSPLLGDSDPYAALAPCRVSQGASKIRVPSPSDLIKIPV